MKKKKSMIRLSTHAIDNPTVVGQDKVVTLHYTLESADKSLREIADQARPFHYLHGSPMLIGSIQDAIEGKSKGDKVSLRLPPENAYGRKDPALVQIVESTIFDEEEDIEIGMMYFQDLEDGRRLATIKSIEGNEVTIDGNHPFAGHILKIDIDIVDIREATEAEITNRVVLH